MVCEAELLLAQERAAYEPIRLLGRGSYGTVILVKPACKTTDETGDRNELQVIKQVELHGVSDKQRCEALREADLLRSLSHANIVACLDAYVEGSTLCIAMEYADGGDLAEAISRRREAAQRYHERDAMAVFVQLALAVRYLHERHIIHRDLKSQNVFLTSNGVVKLGDFGVAKALHTSGCCADTIIGTPYYLPPEICNNEPYNLKADMWCLGVVLYEILALERPFSAPSIAALVIRICAAEPRMLPAVYSQEARTLASSMLAKRAKDRPSIKEVVELPHLRRSIATLPAYCGGGERAPSCGGYTGGFAGTARTNLVVSGYNCLQSAVASCRDLPRLRARSTKLAPLGRRGDLPRVVCAPWSAARLTPCHEGSEADRLTSYAPTSGNSSEAGRSNCSSISCCGRAESFSRSGSSDEVGRRLSQPATPAYARRPSRSVPPSSNSFIDLAEAEHLLLAAESPDKGSRPPHAAKRSPTLSEVPTLRKGVSGSLDFTELDRLLRNRSDDAISRHTPSVDRDIDALLLTGRKGSKSSVAPSTARKLDSSESQGCARLLRSLEIDFGIR